jgi:hypothetical protein
MTALREFFAFVEDANIERRKSIPTGKPDFRWLSLSLHASIDLRVLAVLILNGA